MMGYFDKTIKFIEETPIEELQKRMEEYGVKFVKNKPECSLIGQDGNVFNLIGLASRTLKKAGMKEQADEMIGKCFNAGNYDEALRIIMDYVEVV